MYQPSSLTASCRTPFSPVKLNCHPTVPLFSMTAVACTLPLTLVLTRWRRSLLWLLLVVALLLLLPLRCTVGRLLVAPIRLLLVLWRRCSKAAMVWRVPLRRVLLLLVPTVRLLLLGCTVWLLLWLLLLLVRLSTISRLRWRRRTTTGS